MSHRCVQFEVGRLESVANGTGTVAYTYDRFGRMLQDGDLTYSYDKNGNRVSITYPDGLVATWTHDWMDREAGLAIQESGGSLQTVVHASPAVTYKPFGPLERLRFDLDSTNDKDEVREFDWRYVPTNIRLQAISGSPPSQLFTWDYATDAVGNVIEIDQTQPTSANREYGYQDWQYFLAEADGPWGSRAWEYDRAGNRLSHTSPWLATYGYQQNAATTGNTSELDTVSGTGLQWQDYAFDAGGYQSSFAVVVGGNPLYTLDFTFDAAGQLSFFDHDANPDRSLRYDGRGMLSVVADAAGTTVLVQSTYSSEGLLHSLLRTPVENQPSERLHVLYFAGRPIGIWKKVGTGTATLTRLVTDHLGTPAASILEAGTAVDWYGGFEPFGEDWQAGTLMNSLGKGIFLRMPGQWKDPLWGDATYPMELFYNVHRWYEAGTGRYTKPDPFQRAFLGNTYTYAAGNPARFVDRLGLFEIDPSCDCPPTPLQPDDIGRAIGQARRFYNSASCQKVLTNHPNVKDCLGPRFGPEEIGKGPRIVCKENPPRDPPPCGEYEGSGTQSDPAVIRLFPGHPECPRFKRSQGLGQTIFHETVHSCGLQAHSETFDEIVVGCTGAR